MKKHYDFLEKDGEYLLKVEGAAAVFTVEADLQFDVKSFYQVVFEDVVEACDIEITNKCDQDDKTGKRIYDTLTAITKKICNRLNHECFSEANVS